MSEKEIREMRELDEIAEKAGGYVAPLNDKETQYDYRKMSEYCKEKGIEPLDLTLRELNQFVISK